MNLETRDKTIEILESDSSLAEKHLQLTELKNKVEKSNEEKRLQEMSLKFATEAAEKLGAPIAHSIDRLVNAFHFESRSQAEGMNLQFAELKDVLKEMESSSVKMPTHIKVSEISQLVKGLEKVERKIKDQKIVVTGPTQYKILGLETLDTQLKELFKKMDEGLSVNIASNRDPNNPIAVRLSDGKKFYEAMQAMFALGGSNGKVLRQIRDRLPVALSGAGNLKVSIEEGGITANAANNTYGSVTGVVDEATGTIVNIASSPANFKLRGFLASGTGQGYYELQIAGTTKYFYRTIITDKVAKVILPNPETITLATAIKLQVTNFNGDTQDFEGVILGE